MGHFQADGTFTRDDTGGTPGGAAIAFRSPLSSGCTANPFTADGSSCPSNALGTPFTLVTQAGTPQQLEAYVLGPTGVATLPATNTSSGLTLNGRVNPAGMAVWVQFEYRADVPGWGGLTLQTPIRRIGPANGPTPFSETIATGPNTVHFRAFVYTDFSPPFFWAGDELTFPG